MIKELNNKIDELKMVVEQSDLDVKDGELLDCALRLYLSEKIQENKRENINEIKKQTINKNQELSTEKQKNLLRKIGYGGDMNNLTKPEAFTIIKENLKKEFTENGDY